MSYLYPIFSLAYWAAPVIGLGITGLLARRSGGIHAVRVFVRACLAGVLLGGALAMSYASMGGTALPPREVMVTCYVGVAAVFMVLGLNWLVSQAVSRLFRLDPKAAPGGCYKAAPAAAAMIQAAILVLIALPYLASVLLLYRPEAPTPGDPLALLDAPFQTVHFRATDGVPIESWWIPATRNKRTDGRGSTNRGRDAVLLCHGFGADKAKDLFLARDLVANGYNVLAIDLRAHGRSGGHFTGFGAAEARDVLGAVRWLRVNHPQQCKRVLGLGEGLGAVALIEASADPSREGQAIDAIAAYNPYDEFDAVVTAVAEGHQARFTRWAFMHLVLPIASAQVGADLRHLSPVSAVRSLWPRPILVLGNADSRDPVAGRTSNFYQGVLQPKYLYAPDGEPQDVLHNKTAALTVRIFFDGERSIL